VTARRVEHSEPDAASVRLDQWLWAARFFKTRALAKEAVEGGKIATATGPASKPARPVRVGDRLQIKRGDERFEIEVLALSSQRGPAPVAQGLYREDEASIARRAAEREQRRMEQAGMAHPASRPSKKQRRQIRGLPGGKGPAKWPPWLPE
jgi:ribosome-associated heat shock protein Hsp15